MGRMQLFYRFELQDHLVLDDDIGNIVAHDSLIVENLDRNFFFGLETGFLQFDEQGILIDALQETKAQLVMHFVRALDDLSCEVFVFQLRVFFGTDYADDTDSSCAVGFGPPNRHCNPSRCCQ